MAKKNLNPTNKIVDLFTGETASTYYMSSWMDNRCVWIKYGFVDLTMLKSDWKAFVGFIKRTDSLRKASEAKVNEVRNKNTRRKKL